jgi:hypothetical protein
VNPLTPTGHVIKGRACVSFGGSVWWAASTKWARDVVSARARGSEGGDLRRAGHDTDEDSRAPLARSLAPSVHTDRKDQDMKRDDIDYCESCGEPPATQKDPEDPNAYCDTCVAKMNDQDYGVAFYAIRVMTDAMASLHAHRCATTLRRAGS